MVRCQSASMCFAGYGDGNTSTNIGTLWSTTRPLAGTAAWRPSPIPYNLEGPIACASRSVCLAFRGEQVAVSTRPLSGHWQPLNPFVMAAADTVDGLACPTPTRCIAVSDYGASLGTRNSVQSWQPLSPIGPGGGQSPGPSGKSPFDATVSALSCPSRRLCVAAGVHYFGHPTFWTTPDPLSPTPTWTRHIL
jgi:hypothetical protein